MFVIFFQYKDTLLVDYFVSEISLIKFYYLRGYLSFKAIEEWNIQTRIGKITSGFGKKALIKNNSYYQFNTKG